MRALDSLPVEDPGTPNLTSPGALLRWLAWKQRRDPGLRRHLGLVWMLAQATVPAALGGGINAASSHDERGPACSGRSSSSPSGITQAGAGILRHRMAVTNWITAAVADPAAGVAARGVPRRRPATPGRHR